VACCCQARTNFPRGRSSTRHRRQACSLAPSAPGRSRLDRQASACASIRHQPTFRLTVRRQLQPRLPLRERENRNRAETPQSQHVWPPLLPQPGLCFVVAAQSSQGVPVRSLVSSGKVAPGSFSANCGPSFLRPRRQPGARARALSHRRPAATQRRSHRPVEACSPAFVIRPIPQQQRSSGVLSAAYLPGSASCALPLSCCAISARRDHTLAGSIGTAGSFNRRSSSSNFRAYSAFGQFALFSCLLRTSTSFGEEATHWRLSRKLPPVGNRSR
jgi:hypothetical protein